ncbi:restriction endonuclease subunit S [Segatella buccae]|uniref:restriction endonuclease subunit S n=1 Tax=Segatella buccae TaxID=28126 RepID=UPI0022DF7BF1|nr:restriction endonuclease subunit S [Segatella buccae]
MDTKKLRQKILDLAIHGKLVPQDPNDEPASVLLQRIRTEKERLIKEGKIKRSRKPAKTSDTPHYEQMPFELPQGWVWITLEEISSKIGSGSTPKGGNYSKDGIPFFRSQNVYNEGLVCADMKFISNATHKRMIGTEVRPKDLLLNITGGSLGRCAIVSDEFQIGNVSQHVCIIRPIFVLSSYVHSFILSSLFKKSMNITGSGREGLPKYNLEKMFLPLPPLTEQTRIVTEIEHWTKLIDAIEQGKIALQIAIKQAKSKILELAIHGKLVPQNPADEPASELLKRINPKAEIACDNEHNRKFPDGWAVLKVKDAFIINPRNELDDNTDVGFIPMAYINDGYSGEFKYAQKKWAEIKNGFTHFSDGDIAVAKISPCLENLKSMILKDLPNGVGAGTTELYVFRALYTSSEYSLYFFKSNIFVRKCVGTFNGVVGQQRVGKRIIEDILFPIPPSVEQERIVAKIKELFFFIDEIQESLKA